MRTVPLYWSSLIVYCVMCIHPLPDAGGDHGGDDEQAVRVDMFCSCPAAGLVVLRGAGGGGRSIEQAVQAAQVPVDAANLNTTYTNLLQT